MSEDQPILVVESDRRLGEALASQLAALAPLGLGTEWLVEHPNRLAAVTGEQVAEAALEFFSPTRFTGVVVGDAAQLRSLSALGGVSE